MTSALSVRRAHLGDLDAIVELRLSLLHEYRDHPMYGNLRDDAQERAHQLFRAQVLSPQEAIYLAEKDRLAIGILRCVDTPLSPLFFPERYCYISSVYVRPGERRKGVLRALLGAADAWCAERGIDEMRLHNTTESVAADAWKSLGFGVVEEVRRRPLRAATAPTESAPIAQAAVR